MGKTWPELLPPLQAAGATEAIVRRLGELIGAGLLSPGDRLPTETELAKYLGVSPMTVRNALKVMREHDLVETHRGRGAGTFVREDATTKLQHKENEFPTLDVFADFTVWREAVSGEACAIVAEVATNEQLEELVGLASVVDAPDLSPVEYRSSDARFHLRIAELSGSNRLVEAEQQIQDYLTRTLADTGPAPDSARLKAQGHGSLVDAIVQHDSGLARTCFKEHARATVDVLVGIGYLKS